MDSLKKLYYSSFLLCEYKTLREEFVFKNFITLLYNVCFEENLEKNIQSFSDFVFSLENDGCNDFSEYLQKTIL